MPRLFLACLCLLAASPAALAFDLAPSVTGAYKYSGMSEAGVQSSHGILDTLEAVSRVSEDRSPEELAKELILCGDELAGPPTREEAQKVSPKEGVDPCAPWLEREALGAPTLEKIFGGLLDSGEANPHENRFRELGLSPQECREAARYLEADLEMGWFSLWAGEEDPHSAIALLIHFAGLWVIAPPPLLLEDPPKVEDKGDGDGEEPAELGDGECFPD